jgi:hypothetical protein
MLVHGREVSESNIRFARKMAEFYRARGFACLPSRPDDKRPMCLFAQYWESSPPADLFVQFPTTNIQLIAGRHHGLIGVDFDGDEAKIVAQSWGPLPRTWITRNGGKGEHWWFTVDRKMDRPLQTGFLWKGDGRHSGIERIADKGLLMAPPSIHPDDPSRRYKFVQYHDPTTVPMPAPAPRWLVERDILREAKPVLWMPKVLPKRNPSEPSPGGKRFRFDEVLDSIPDKSAVAAEWGVRFTGKITAQGWAECRAYDRPDAKPSAVVHTDTGYYVDRGSGIRMSLFDLGATLGVAPTPYEVMQLLGDRYVR